MFIFKIQPSKEIIGALEKYCQKRKIKAGWMDAIGALEQAVLAHFNPQTQKYSEKIFKRQLEIASLQGIISVCRGKLHFHLHAVLGDKNFQTFSGHLKSGIANPTAEVVIFESRQKLIRTKNKPTGLDLLKNI